MKDLTPVDQPLPLDFEQSREMAAALSRALRRAARQARQPTPLIAGGGVPTRRGDRAFRLGVISSFLAIVAAPALAGGIYWGLIASPQYASEAKFTLRSGESSALDSLGGFAGLPSSRQAQDTQVIVSYIQSPAILKDIEKTVDLQSIYGAPSIDYFSRLEPDAPIEKLEKYWRKRVDVKPEGTSGIVTVEVRAFTPQDSEKIANEIVRLSENLVNDMANRPRRDALAQTATEMKRAEEDLQKSTLAMRDARNSEGVLDAGASALAINNVISALQLQLADTESSLSALGPLGQNAPQANVLRAKIDKLKQQIAAFKDEIAGSDGTQNMADRLKTLSRVQTDLDVARQRYAEASASYQAARVDMETQRAYVVAFLKPILAQKSTYPRRWLEWLLVVGAGLLLWSVGAGVAFQARDNMAK